MFLQDAATRFSFDSTLTFIPPRIPRPSLHWLAKAPRAPRIFWGTTDQMDRLAGRASSELVSLLSNVFLSPSPGILQKNTPSTILLIGAIAARFTHDIISLAAFGVDAGSINATAERPCDSFDAVSYKMKTLEMLLGHPERV